MSIAIDDARRMLLVGGPELDDRWYEVINLCADDPDARAELADLHDRATELEDEHTGAGWIALMLRVLHEAPFVAFDLEQRVGIAGRMSGVADNFQLHTLLLDVFPHPRRLLRRPQPRVSAAAAAVAHGAGPQSIDESINGVWNLYTHHAIVDGRLPDPKDRSMWPTWIWNEGVPADIPELDGHRVIILGPAPYGRGWQADRVFAGLPVTFETRELARAEVDAWAAKVGA